MRSFKHWTPRYIKNRLLEKHYCRAYPGRPWLTRQANEILASYLKNSDLGLEFGSGRSTVWFAARVANLTSVEHDPLWYEKVCNMLKKQELDNVDYRLVPVEDNSVSGDASEYVRTLFEYEAETVDFVLVDGVYRDLCALHSLHVIRPGGVLIIDNVNWFLPSNSCSPNSRSVEQGPNGPIWAQVSDALSHWRVIWTSSGVTDTAFYFKPCKG